MKKCEDDAKAVNALLGSLVSNEFAKVVGCTTSKDIWDKLKSVHEGDDKIKEAKLQHHRNLFESLKMSGGETTDQFMSKVNEIINSIRGLGEEVKDAVVVKKILRSLPDLYNPKVSAIKESKNLNTMKLDELHGTLIGYEMRMVKPKPKPIENEATFKALKKLKINEDSEQKDSDDELIAYLARKLKKGRGKYKGKLPLKCFNCDGIGHFASKCPKNDKLSDSEDEDAQEKESSEDYNESDDESSETLFMALGDRVQRQTTEEYEEEEEQEAQYDLIANLHSGLIDLKEERKKMKDLEIQLVENENQISQLNITVEDMAKINDELSVNLSSKAEECITLEEKLEILKIELKKDT
ncbi:uncharacterized protein LOC122066468 [Macadamia integrifolia]|uniref:uncharacterized protein LOC122066468 n=1 Tax=Macadamia integrifolia TaxID=60698 RepID=UPI001C4EA576|nr:uncharacterized protein LOC122066468 [Macadamia integrifolia]